MARFLVLLLLLATPAFADTITYRFAGENLTGTLILDADTPFTVVSAQLAGTHSEMRSPLNRISGTWNAIDFEGDALLSTLDSASDLSPHFWIIRSNITGGNLARLNLFIFKVGGGAGLPASLIPPPHAINNRADFGYTVGFTDGSFTGGQLSELAVVPESPWLLAVGLLAAIGLRLAGIDKRLTQ